MNNNFVRPLIHCRSTGWLGAGGLLALAALSVGIVQAATLLDANFNGGVDGFVYGDDAFGASESVYASGAYTGTGGYNGTDGLQVTLGGVDNNSITGMSGGWSHTLNVAAGGAPGVVLSFRYKLTQTATYEYDEYSRVLVKVDGVQHGRGAKDYVDHVSGDGNSGSGNGTGNRNVFTPTTEWQQHQVYLGDWAEGGHTIVLGACNRKKNATDESTTLVIDDVLVTSGNAAPAVSDAQKLVNRVSQAEYLSHIQGVAQFNDRCRMSGCASTDYLNAVAWLEGELQALGYTPYRHVSSANGTSTINLWATKLGATTPTQMYMISAHLDGRSGGDAFDDDGSGVAVVLEAARVFAGADVTTDKSVRFLFWDKEEIGYKGADNYVRDRRALQGRMDLNPPEPTWLGLITHDMVLYDHGVGSGGPDQSFYADLDVEWRAGTTKEADSKALANHWRYFNGAYSTDYPASAWNYSYYTDDGPFWPYVASVSVRENRRILDGSITDEEWINPYYHTTGDVEASYSEADIRLGYNAAQATIGAVAELAGVYIAGANHPPTANSQSVTTPQDTPVAITLTGSDPDGDDLTYEIISDPSHGQLSGDAPNLTYTPAPGYTGADSFTFVVNDGADDSWPATVSITVSPPGPVEVFFEDFETDKGWTRNAGGTDTAASGVWEQANPESTSSSGAKQLGTTVSGSHDLVTGPLAGSSAGSYDVDGGVTSIRSPAIPLPSSDNLTVTFSYYMAHANNSSSADYLRVKVVGTTTATLLQELGAGNDDDAAWAPFSGSLSAFAGQTVRLLVECADASGASLVECAIDDVRIVAQ